MAGTTLQQIHALQKENEKQKVQIKELKEQNAVNKANIENIITYLNTTKLHLKENGESLKDLSIKII